MGCFSAGHVASASRRCVPTDVPSVGRWARCPSVLIGKMPILRTTICFLLLMLAANLSASDARGEPVPLSEAKVEMRYQAVGDQLFCICGGCRDKLLECSHNVCDAKDQERAFLRELAKDPSLNQIEMKSAMVKRFGEKILLAPSDSGLYLLVAGGVLFLIVGFSFGARYLTKAAPEPEDTEPELETDMDSALEQRIADDLKELD